MVSRTTFLIIGRLPTSPLYKSLQAKYDITHINTKTMSREEFAKEIALLPNKSFNCAVVLQEAMQLYPLNKDLFDPLSIGCLCKIGAGYDSIDVDYFTQRGTWIANAPNAVMVPTAEWSAALILSTVKGLGIADHNVRQGKWREGLGLQRNISGLNLGIVGLGAIGKEVVKRLNVWGFNTLYTNRQRLPPDEEKALSVKYVPLKTLWEESDVISLHCPLTPETYHLINSKTLSQCKKGVFIVNTSRGKVIDERALVEALKSGQVSRAGLDVFEREPEIEKELLEDPNVILSPHYAALTYECMAALTDEALENTLAYIEKGRPNTPVNEPRASI